MVYSSPPRPWGYVEKLPPILMTKILIIYYNVILLILIGILFIGCKLNYTINDLHNTIKTCNTSVYDLHKHLDRSWILK